METEKFTFKELEKSLTEKQKIFCHEYIKLYNGTQSYFKAYSPKNENTAGVEAHKQLRKPKIQQYIEYIKDDIAKEAKISKLALISELKKIAMSDISELYLDWFKMDDFNELKNKNPEILSCIQEISTKIQKISVDGQETPIDVEYVRVKMYDKKGAIMDIMKAMGWDKTTDTEEVNDNVIMLNFGGAVDMSDYLADDSTE